MSMVSRSIHGIEIRVSERLCNGRYIVQNILAAGGQGFVLIAEDTRLANNRVLIKVPLYDQDLLSLGFHNFLEEKYKRQEDTLYYEVELVDALNRRVQNVPHIVDYFNDDNLMLIGTHHIIGGGGTWTINPGDEACRDLFVVYELLSAGQGKSRTLENVIEDQQGPLDDRFVLLMAKQITDVLVQLHERMEPIDEDRRNDPDLYQYYYLYQDLKPANILVTGERVDEPYFFLIDFGGITPCNLRRVGKKLVPEIPRGSGAYTVGYAAPEIFHKKEPIDQRFDIFTLGATIFHTFTGEHPSKLIPNFDPQKGSAPDFGFMQLNKYKIFQETDNPLIREVIFLATQADPRDRYDSIEQMRDDVILALEGN